MRKCNNCIHYNIVKKTCKYNKKDCKHYSPIFACCQHLCNGCGKCERNEKV